MAIVLESCSIGEICAELGEDVRTLKELQIKLLEWLQMQPHLPKEEFVTLTMELMGIRKIVMMLLFLSLVATAMGEKCYMASSCARYCGSDDGLVCENRECFCDGGDFDDYHITEKRLEHFIISTKLSLEQAKQKLDMYYTVRRLVPELFNDRDPMRMDLTRIRKTFQWIALPELTPEKYRVSIFRALDSNPENFNAADFFKSSFMIGDIRISECRNLGEVYIYDLGAMRLGHLTKLTPTLLKKCEITATQAFGARIKEVHLINVPNFIDSFIKLAKSVLKPKIASRIHVHSSSLETLWTFIPKSIIPSDYGGDQSSMNELSESWEQKLAEWRDWFVAQENISADESLRPGKAIDDNQLFGFSGSFRKLDID